MYNSGCWRLFSDYLRCFLAFDCTLSEVKLTIYFQSTKQTCSGVANGSLLFFLSPVTLYNIVTQGENSIFGASFFFQTHINKHHSHSYLSSNSHILNEDYCIFIEDGAITSSYINFFLLAVVQAKGRKVRHVAYSLVLYIADK